MPTVRPSARSCPRMAICEGFCDKRMKRSMLRRRAAAAAFAMLCSVCESFAAASMAATSCCSFIRVDAADVAAPVVVVALSVDAVVGALEAVVVATVGFGDVLVLGIALAVKGAAVRGHAYGEMLLVSLEALTLEAAQRTLWRAGARRALVRLQRRHVVGLANEIGLRGQVDRLVAIHHVEAVLLIAHRRVLCVGDETVTRALTLRAYLQRVQRENRVPSARTC